MVSTRKKTRIWYVIKYADVFKGTHDRSVIRVRIIVADGGTPYPCRFSDKTPKMNLFSLSLHTHTPTYLAGQATELSLKMHEHCAEK